MISNTLHFNVARLAIWVVLSFSCISRTLACSYFPWLSSFWPTGLWSFMFAFKSRKWKVAIGWGHDETICEWSVNWSSLPSCTWASMFHRVSYSSLAPTFVEVGFNRGHWVCELDSSLIWSIWLSTGVHLSSWLDSETPTTASRASSSVSKINGSIDGKLRRSQWLWGCPSYRRRWFVNPKRTVFFFTLLCCKSVVQYEIKVTKGECISVLSGTNSPRVRCTHRDKEEDEWVVIVMAPLSPSSHQVDRKGFESSMNRASLIIHHRKCSFISSNRQVGSIGFSSHVHI